MKKLLTVVLALCLVLSMNAMAFAEGSNGASGEADIIAALPASSKNTTNNITNNADGTTTYTAAGETTTTKTSDGTTVATTVTSDGTKVVAAETTAADGTKDVALTVTLSDTAAKADEVILKTEVAAADEPTIKVEIPAGADEITLDIPVKDADVNTVAVIVNADGTETVICSTKQTANGVAVKLEEGATLKIIDNEKEFTDVNEAAWAEENIDFVTSREIFQGETATEFGPNDNITRQMAFTALARYDGNNKAQYAEGTSWAKTTGLTDGTALADDITREELATLLWRYAGSPAVTGTLGGYTDGADVSTWAAQAMQWCINQGIFKGVDANNGTALLPAATATRAELAAVIQRFCNAF